MSLFADDGLIATKPYVSGGSYIRKMSSYCKGCTYDPTVRHGPRACPFSSLYWHFLARHEARLRPNPRMAQMYANWYKLPEAERAATLAQADAYLEGVEGL
jgi:deoxyribodipyrimidine photolyase-related protein